MREQGLFVCTGLALESLALRVVGLLIFQQLHWVQGDECSCDLCTVDEYIYDLFKTRSLPICVVLVFNISFYLAPTV